MLLDQSVTDLLHPRRIYARKSHLRVIKSRPSNAPKCYSSHSDLVGLLILVHELHLFDGFHDDEMSALKNPTTLHCPSGGRCTGVVYPNLLSKGRSAWLSYLKLRCENGVMRRIITELQQQRITALLSIYVLFVRTVFLDPLPLLRGRDVICGCPLSLRVNESEGRRARQSGACLPKVPASPMQSPILFGPY